MDWKSQLIQFVRDQGPIILFSIISYMNSKVIRAENKARSEAIHNKIEENHEKIKILFSGKSDDGIIKSVISTGPESKS